MRDAYDEPRPTPGGAVPSSARAPSERAHPRRGARPALGAPGCDAGTRMSRRQQFASARWRPMGRSRFRSEERRVGKECRSRWASNHEEKRTKINVEDRIVRTEETVE